jgi:hypothetical protein
MDDGGWAAVGGPRGSRGVVCRVVVRSLLSCGACVAFTP